LPERKGFMRVWAGIAIGVAVVALAVLFLPLVQIQRDLRLASEQVVEARARVAELERIVANLKTELGVANRARTQLQDGLDQANSEIERRQFELERLTDELEKATNAAKRAETPDQEGDSASEPSDAWKPQENSIQERP
jgi:septal ring factor EnvC (AmiA/AmiB activator)